jgi:hypothetical protein
MLDSRPDTISFPIRLKVLPANIRKLSDIANMIAVLVFLF